MPRSQKIQTNFTAGEISPRLLGRVDIAKYQNAARVMEGFYPLVHGGANRDPGLRYIAATKFPTKESRPIPFVFSATQAYILEFGDLYMRVFKDEGQVLSGGVPYEMVTPYAEANLPDLNYVQSADTAFLVQPSFPVRKLTRSGHAAWKIAAFPFLVEPHDETGTKPAAALTLGAVTGTGINANAGSAFEIADVGRQITAGDGVATIVGYVDTSNVTVDIISDFAAVGVASGNWTLTESPKATLTSNFAGPEGTFVTLTLSAAGFKNAPTTDSGRYVHLNGGVIEVGAFTSAVSMGGVVRSALLSAAPAPAGSWSLETKVWNATNGYPRAVTLFEQRLVLAGTTAFPNRVWASRTARYNDFTVGPADNDALDLDMVSDQQNPIMQLAPLRALIPLTYGGEFSIRSGIEKPLTATNNQAKPESQYGIKNVRPVRVGSAILFVQRAGRKIRSLEYRVDKDSFDSPDRTKLAEHITEGGITDMCYAQEPDSIVSLVRADGLLVRLAINLEDDAQVVGFARRRTDGLIKRVAAIPYNDTDQVWAIVKRTINGADVRNMELFDPLRNTDSCVVGSLAAIAITAISWAAGVVTALTASPHGLAPGSSARIAGVTPAAYNGDQLCIAGTAASTIKYSLETDPGVATVLGTATPLAATWTGFGHMEAKTIDILADGVVFPQALVSGGAVTLGRPVASIEGGLHYRSTLTLLNPELPLPDGSVQGRPVSINELVVRLYKTEGGEIRTGSNVEKLPFRKFGAGVLDKPLTPYTGDKLVNLLGWDKSTDISFVQDQPLPAQILAAIYKLSVGD